MHLDFFEKLNNFKIISFKALIKFLNNIVYPNKNRDSMVQRESIRGLMVNEGEREGEKGSQEEATLETPKPAPEPESELELEEEEDPELEIIEQDPPTIFLYNPFDLTTSRRKRIQVQWILFL